MEAGGLRGSKNGAAALERRKHEVHIFTRRGPGMSSYDNLHGVHYHRCDFENHSNFVDEIGNHENNGAAALHF